MSQNINTKVTNAAKSATFSGFSVDIISSSISGGALKIKLDNLIRFPLFRLFVDSDYLELLIKYGKPQITCPTDKLTFNAGETGKVTVKATNIGDAEGGFNIRVKSCGTGFEAGDTKALTLASKASSDVTLKVTSDVPENVLTGSCVIEMKESWSQETATCNVQLESNPLASCTAGNKWCDYSGSDSVIMECKSGKEAIVEKCLLSCNYDSTGAPLCLKTEDGVTIPECKWYQESYVTENCPIRCILGLDEPTSKVGCKTAPWSIFAIIGGIIVFIIIVWIMIKRAIHRPPKQYPQQQYYPSSSYPPNNGRSRRY
jgi:hypothetical protein